MSIAAPGPARPESGSSTRPRRIARAPAGRPRIRTRHAHQLEALRAAGVREVVVVVGHREDQVRRFLAGFDGPAVRVVRNPDYLNTKNMYSLYLLRDLVGTHEFVLANGDDLHCPRPERDCRLPGRPPADG